MTATIIDGLALSQNILEELRVEVAQMRAKHGQAPGLVTILVGDNPASASYVSRKVKTAHSLGFHEVQDNRPADISEADLLALIEHYNADPAIHGSIRVPREEQDGGDETDNNPQNTFLPYQHGQNPFLSNSLSNSLSNVL